MNTQELNKEGRKIVEAELLRRGASSVITSRTRKVCIHVNNSTGSRMVDISVKTKRKGNWHTNLQEGIQTTKPSEIAEATKFWIFIDFSSVPRYWIVPDWWIRNNIYEAHKKYLEKHGGHRARNNKSNHHSIEEERLEGWQNKWDILEIQ